MYDPFAQLRGPTPNYLQELLSISKKSELKKFAKQIEITQQDFATLVCNAAALGYYHEIKPREFRPADANLESDWVFGQSEDGKPTPETIRTIKKINQIFHQRRLLAAHIFINRQRWHIFYFDQRDMDASSQNQWKHGSHIHFVNDLWPNYDPQVIWNLLELAKTPIKDSLHIRYDPQETEDSDSPIPFPAA
jgi:hypothetical protein